jgi:hypothetical protein
VDRRHSGFVVLAALLVFGSLGTHALVYAIAQPDARDRAALLARTGHGWLSWTPAIAGTAALALVLALALTAFRAAAGTASRRLHPALAAVPVLGFVLQETVERAISGMLSPSLYTANYLLLGLLLQGLLGLACVVVARLLVGGAEELGRLFGRRPPLRAVLAAAPMRLEPFDLLRPAPLAARVAGRAPPASAS